MEEKEKEITGDNLTMTASIGDGDSGDLDSSGETFLQIDERRKRQIWRRTTPFQRNHDGLRQLSLSQNDVVEVGQTIRRETNQKVTVHAGSHQTLSRRELERVLHHIDKLIISASQLSLTNSCL